MTRFLAFLAGIAVVAAATHANVMHAGGYGSENAPLIITLAGLIAIGMAFVGSVWANGHRGYAVVLAVSILCGECYWLLLNAEREVAAREKDAGPALQQHNLHVAAKQRFADAMAAKERADASAVSEAAKDGCRKNCAALLQAAQNAAAIELSEARTALAQTPEPLSFTPLSDRLGVPSWAWDLILAGLRSAGVLGGSLAVGLTLHGKRKVVVATNTMTSTCRSEPKLIVENSHNPPKTADVAAFAAACLFPAPYESVESKTLWKAYFTWAQKNGLQALSLGRFDEALSALCKAAELKMQQGKVLGVKLAA